MAVDPKDVKTPDLPGLVLTPHERLSVRSALGVAVAMKLRARQKEPVGSEFYALYSRDIDALNRLKEKFV